MSVVNGQLANQTTFNTAFMSRTAPSTSTVAIVALQNTDLDSGLSIANAQKAINKAFDSDGTLGESDATAKTYSSTNYIANGDNRKVALGKLDAQLFSTQTDLDADEVILADHAARINTIENLNSTFNGDKIFSANVTVQGNFTVNGTQTIVNSTDMQVTDRNILVNKGGDDLSAEEAGLDVQRTTTNGALRFDSTLGSKWKIGLVGTLYEILVSGPAQAISGIKSFVNGLLSDTIDERTLNAGVTIEAVLIKDGLVDGRDVSADGAIVESITPVNKTETVAAAGSFTGPTKYKEKYLIQSTGGAVTTSNTPLGSIAPPNGARILFVGQSDINPVTFPFADVAFGFLLQGDRQLKLGDILEVEYDATLNRYLHIASNSFSLT